MHPPDPKMRNPSAGQGKGGIISQKQFQHRRQYRTRPRKQAASLRRRFGLEYYFATIVAQLAWGALPR
jgi:hypothetical protein